MAASTEDQKRVAENIQYSGGKDGGTDMAKITSTDSGEMNPTGIRYRGRTGNEIDVTAVQPGTDKVYAAKVILMNQAILDLGMGKYQWFVACLTGFGWYIDNVSDTLLFISASTA